MKNLLLPKILLAGALLTTFSFAAHADDRGRNSQRSQRSDFRVSADARNHGHRGDDRLGYNRGGRGYYYAGRGYHGNRGFYRGGYYGYGYPYYYGGPSIAIGVGSGYYNTEYVGTVSDDDRPIYRGQQVSETTSSSLGVSVQKKLARLGYYKGELDGDIGPASTKAIVRFQRDNDLAETGRIDRNLVQALGLS